MPQMELTRALAPRLLQLIPPERQQQANGQAAPAATQAQNASSPSGSASCCVRNYWEMRGVGIWVKKNVIVNL